MDENIENVEQTETVEEPHGDTTDWKAMARKWERIAKANKAAAVDSERLEAMEREMAELKAERDAMKRSADISAWKTAASEKYGVPADVLRGDTEEDIAAHAEAIKAHINYFPSVGEGNRDKTPATSKESIAAIKSDRERLEAIKNNIELFS